jgi:hypothetical protein
MQRNIENSIGTHSYNSSTYDAFNAFIFSTDRKILNKLLYRYELFNRVGDLNGDIVECGVFKGSGLMIWAKLLQLMSPYSNKKVIGFDWFGDDFVQKLDLESKTAMEEVFNRCHIEPNGINSINKDDIAKKLVDGGINRDKFELIEGDIIVTSKNYVTLNPGFRISLLYMDLDLEEPTLETLNNLWPRVVTGGIVVFDEYSYGRWSESNAVDEFVRQHKLVLYTTYIETPSAYIVKN